MPTWKWRNFLKRKKAPEEPYSIEYYHDAHCDIVRFYVDRVDEHTHPNTEHMLGVMLHCISTPQGIEITLSLEPEEGIKDLQETLQRNGFSSAIAGIWEVPYVRQKKVTSQFNRALKPKIGLLHVGFSDEAAHIPIDNWEKFWNLLKALYEKHLVNDRSYKALQEVINAFQTAKPDQAMNVDALKNTLAHLFKDMGPSRNGDTLHPF